MFLTNMSCNWIIADGKNKSRYLISFLECIIRWGILKRIEVGFPPVGHIHDDIDQTFSKTANLLQSNDVHTLGQFHKQMGELFNGATTVVKMKHVLNWSGLCEKEKCLIYVSGFSHYRDFKFKSFVGLDSTLSTAC